MQNRAGTTHFTNYGPDDLKLLNKSPQFSQMERIHGDTLGKGQQLRIDNSWLSEIGWGKNTLQMGYVHSDLVKSHCAICCTPIGIVCISVSNPTDPTSHMSRTRKKEEKFLIRYSSIEDIEVKKHSQGDNADENSQTDGPASSTNRNRNEIIVGDKEQDLQKFSIILHLKSFKPDAVGNVPAVSYSGNIIFLIKLTVFR